MKPMNPQKRRVIELITLGGYSLKDAAREAGVGYSTLTGWTNSDPEFRKRLDEWTDGPGVDTVAVAQSKRIIIDELARRILHNRSDLTVRELLNIHDRISKEENTSDTEANHDDDSEPDTGTIELTPEQVERLWDEIAQDKQRASEFTTDESAKPEALH